MPPPDAAASHPLSWLELIHTVATIAIAIGLLVACLLLSRSHQELRVQTEHMRAVYAELQMRNRQGAEAVSLLRQAAERAER